MLKKIYNKLPLTPAQRYRFGVLKRQLIKWWRGDVIKINGIESVEVMKNFKQVSEHAERWCQPVAAGQYDYVFFGVIDWHFRHQRPQQLALSIAKSGRRVFYISVNFVDNDNIGFSIEQLHDTLPLFQVFFNLPGLNTVYSGSPNEDTLQRLLENQRTLWQTCMIQRAVHVVQHPYWYGVASFAAPARLVYDCMDFHAGFTNNGDSHESSELKLLKLSDLTIVTSDYLYDFAKNNGVKRVQMVRNAAEFNHFHAAVLKEHKNSETPVIGYYGAIAEWFDPVIIEKISKAYPHARIDLVGDDTANVQSQLSHCLNVYFHGERPYSELPNWLRSFDVCLIPFRITPLTLATNPVKVYEYLSAGKPVVGTDMPELGQFRELVYRAIDSDAFVNAVGEALQESANANEALVNKRIEFARTQTWQERAKALVEAAENPYLEPLTSVIVVSYNQWALTHRCLKSINDNSETNSIQIIVIDNASVDDTPTNLNAWRAEDPDRRKVILNNQNLGFGPAVNQGLKHALGDYLVVLNNDTIVSPGWLRGMRRHFEVNPKLGVLCPVTNNIGNEAQVALKGNNPSEILESARHYNLGRSGQLLPLSIAAFFCVMIPRRVYEAVGGLDEQFVPGFFEDDDYCMRVKQAGLSVACAEDVFVYHELSASFDKLSSERRQAVFEKNKALFEKKWGKWVPHVYRAESLH